MIQLKSHRLFAPLSLTLVLLAAACSRNSENANTTATSTVTPPPLQLLTLVPRPTDILDLMKQRGEQDKASPVLRIISPAKDAVINSSTVMVKLGLTGDLKGYRPHKDSVTGEGNHIHVILDNEPYEAYYELDQPFELRNVSAGKHTLRVFASRPWHEGYKNVGSFQVVAFTVKTGGDVAKPTITKSGQTMVNNNSSAEAGKTPDGKETPNNRTGEVDLSKPLLTYSRPKGEYKGTEADPIMIDFWLSNAKLKGDGGEYRVRYIVDDDEPGYIDKWGPIWLSGWLSGKHIVHLELLDKDNKPFQNGEYNVTTREITVVK